jgi:alpha-tubulin suppressor-like RCC1 family protein
LEFQNFCGVLGLGHKNFVLKPTIINELCDKNIVEFKSGCCHCLARTFDGKIYSFGMNFLGHLGIGKKDNDFHKPEIVKNLNDMKIIDMCCAHHSLILTNLGDAYAWGDNYFGQIDVVNRGNFQSFPIKVYGFNSERVVIISCGNNHSMALTECDHVLSWGNNDCGQLGYEKASNERKRPEINSVKENKMNTILINKFWL